MFWLAAVVLAASLLFGGAGGSVSEAIPELLSLPLLALALPRALPILKRSPSALALSAGAIVLPCIQLIPLPPALWSALPGRDIVAQILTSADAPLSWRPISLIPSETWRALLSLLPAVATFWATLSLERDARRLLLLLAVAIGVASALLAMLQVLGGSDSGLYFFRFTNPGNGVGFFAGSNHFGTFEYILLPLGAAALAETPTRSSAFLLAVLGGVAPALLFGIALSGSRSAIVLGTLAAVATLGFLLTPEFAKLGRRRSLALLSAYALAILPLAMGLGLLQILSRFAEKDIAEDYRWRFAANTVVGIWNFFPFGAGLGTFPSAYPLIARAADSIPEFVNHAHNDALETLFEGGVGSLLLLLGFVAWLATATYHAFVREGALEGRQARAGAIAMWLLLLNSLWEYPLRTIALEALFGLCAALQFAPPQTSHEHLSLRWPWSEEPKDASPKTSIARPRRASSWHIAIGRVAFVALLLALGSEIVRFSLGDLLSGDDPELSTIVDPTQTVARVAVSRRLMTSDLSKTNEALAGAREALRDNPLTPEALTLLARASEQKGDEDRASQLMNLASRVNPKDLRSQLWLLNQDLRSARVDSALERIDVLLRGRPLGIDQLAPALASIVTREPYRSAYVKLLRTNPPWRPVWFGDVISRATDLTALDYLFAELQAAEPGPTEKELTVFLTRLIEGGMFDEAHDAWLRSLPPERREEADLLYNAGFHYPLTNLPFEWVITPVPGALAQVETQDNESVLNIVFLGGPVNFEHVTHLLNLAPGAYQFKGREQSEDLQNELGLRWRIFCVDDTADTLATTALMNGDTPWRDFSVDFVVPTDKCLYQKLVLELPARTALETEIRGRASYADLDLRVK